MTGSALQNCLMLILVFVMSDRLQLENDRLRQEVQMLTIRLKQSAHMQELAHMLQESHKYV